MAFSSKYGWKGSYQRLSDYILSYTASVLFSEVGCSDVRPGKVYDIRYHTLG